jgi:hypothetical protein
MDRLLILKKVRGSVMGVRIRSVVAGIAVAAGMALAIPTGVAQATEPVSCSDGKPVRLEIDLGGGFGTRKCFAKAGALAVSIGGVYRISAGNNKTTINYEWDGRYYTKELGPGAGVAFGKKVRVYEVRIW